MAETPFELTPQSVSDIVDALSIAMEYLDDKTEDPDGLFDGDYTDEDLEEMRNKSQRMNELFDQLIVVLTKHHLGADAHTS